MKRKYIKPEIMFEDFSLSTNIAGTCQIKVETMTYGTCGIESSGLGMVFLDNILGCSGFSVSDTDPSESVFEGEFDSLCYHVPSNAQSLFNS